MSKHRANFLFLLVTLITVNLWVLSKSNISLSLNEPLTAVAQLSGLLGIVFMSMNLVLSTRFRVVEKFLGGLDSVYYSHQILGSTAFLLILNHPLMMAIRSIPNYRIAGMYLFPGTDIIYDFGIYAVYVMISAFIFIVFIKLPYHIWKITHQFLGLTFLLGSIHALFITSDISSYQPLRWYVIFFIAIGLTSAFYSIFLYKKMGPKFLYEVSKIERKLNVFNIYFKPLTRRVLNYLPGQFLFVEFGNDRIGNELHPFSISSAPFDPALRISVKTVGDYTLKLEHAAVGDKAFLYGPYGAFGKIQENKVVMWIAGGIGVTPFINMLKSELKNPQHKEVVFFNSYRNVEEGVFNSEIEEMVKTTSHIRYFDWPTVNKRRLTAEKINNLYPIKDIDVVYCCGPTKMMESLKKQFIGMGFPEENFIYEDFAFDA